MSPENNDVSPSAEMTNFLKQAVRSSEVPDNKIDSSISTANTFFLSIEELNSLTEKANQGDSDAALRISKYYTFSERVLDIQIRKSKELFWLEVAADNGNVVAQYNLALYFETIQEYKIAKKWAQLALKNGDLSAKLLLQDIEIKLRNKK